jgi:HTH-type transcriptional regulator/antitoxin HigA
MARPLPPPHRLDWTVHPGEVLLDELRERRISQTELAQRTGFSLKHINQVIHGRAALRPALALAIEDATDIPAHVLVRIQADHDLWEAAHAAGERYVVRRGAP